MAGETGFPSPAQGYEATAIDLNTLLVHNPPATFFMRMKGNKLAYRGIVAEDLLIVDRSRRATHGCLVVFRDDGDFICRELVRNGDGLAITDGQNAFTPITEYIELFGTVTGVIRKL